MGSVEIMWKLNIPELYGLPDFSLDDADADSSGNVYVSDSVNGCVFKLAGEGGETDRFDIGVPSPDENVSSGLNLAVSSDSMIYVADAARELVTKHNDQGATVGEFAVPGVLSLCHGPDGLVYALANDEGIERINSYDQLGMIDAIPAPARYRAHLDSVLVNLDSDSDGNVYVSYGMPPYRIWKVKADGSAMDAWGRELDFPEDAVLISDIAVDSESGVLWALLAYKEHGLQSLDAFSLDGEFLGTHAIPHSSNLYGVICTSESGLYLLDTGTGPGAGDLVRIKTLL